MGDRQEGVRGLKPPPRPDRRKGKIDNIPKIDNGASSTFDRYRPIFQKQEENHTAYSDVIMQKTAVDDSATVRKKKYKKKKNNKALKDMIYYLIMVIGIGGLSFLAFKFG